MTFEQRFGACPPNNEASHEAYVRWKDRRAVWIKAKYEAFEEAGAVAYRLCGGSLGSTVGAAIRQIEAR